MGTLLHLDLTTCTHDHIQTSVDHVSIIQISYQLGVLLTLLSNCYITESFIEARTHACLIIALVLTGT